jgi:Na+/glutamate symporter
MEVQFSDRSLVYFHISLVASIDSLVRTLEIPLCICSFVGGIILRHVYNLLLLV